MELELLLRIVPGQGVVDALRALELELADAAQGSQEEPWPVLAEGQDVEPGIGLGGTKQGLDSKDVVQGAGKLRVLGQSEASRSLFGDEEGCSLGPAVPQEIGDGLFQRLKPLAGFFLPFLLKFFFRFQRGGFSFGFCRHRFQRGCRPAGCTRKDMVRPEGPEVPERPAWSRFGSSLVSVLICCRLSCRGPQLAGAIAVIMECRRFSELLPGERRGR